MGKSWNSGDIHKMAFYAAMYTKEAAGAGFAGAHRNKQDIKF